MQARPARSGVRATGVRIFQIMSTSGNILMWTHHIIDLTRSGHLSGHRVSEVTCDLIQLNVALFKTVAIE